MIKLYIQIKQIYNIPYNRHPIKVTLHFLWMPNCSVGPPECETKLSSKYFGMGYVEMHGFHSNA